jgi:hypothetical protein
MNFTQFPSDASQFAVNATYCVLHCVQCNFHFPQKKRLNINLFAKFKHENLLTLRNNITFNCIDLRHRAILKTSSKNTLRSSFNVQPFALFPSRISYFYNYFFIHVRKRMLTLTIKNINEMFFCEKRQFCERKVNCIRANRTGCKNRCTSIQSYLEMCSLKFKFSV